MKGFVITALSICLGTSALASGPMAPHSASPFIWTGGYAGLSLAVPMGNTAWYNNTTPNALVSWENLQGTLVLGYDRQEGNLVYGAAVDATFGTMSALDTANVSLACGVFAGCTSALTDLYRLRGRVGMARGNPLFYGTAGFASGYFTGSTPGLGVHGAGRMQGYSAGFGIEHAMSEHLTLTAEYLYTDLGSIALPTGCGVCWTAVSFGTVRLGGNFRF